MCLSDGAPCFNKCDTNKSVYIPDVRDLFKDVLILSQVLS